MSFVLVRNTSDVTVSVGGGTRYIYPGAWAAADADTVAADVAAGRLVVVDDTTVGGASNPEAQAAKVALDELRASVKPAKAAKATPPPAEPEPEPEPPAGGDN